MRTLKHWIAVSPRPFARARRRERGQALVIIAAAMIPLLAFIGFTVDTGVVFLAHGHLRRAVDAAALAAASQFREGATEEDLVRMTRQFIAFNGVNPDLLNVDVDTCNTDPAMCTDPPRKFVRVRASLIVNLVFLPIIGFNDFPVTSEATSEAASVDAVIVIDTSESMCYDTDTSGVRQPWACSSNYDPDSLTPGSQPTPGCNRAEVYQDNPNGPVGVVNPYYKCRPLWDAKFAAKGFLDQLLPGYDQVALVTFDYKPVVRLTLTSTIGTDDTGSSYNSTGAYKAIDDIPLHDDAFPPGEIIGQLPYGGANPLNFDCNYTNPGACPGAPDESKSFLSTCSGCGIRTATQLLQVTGRPSALWVIIFLSDGAVNMSDVPMSCPGDPNCGTILDPGINGGSFPNGFCSGGIAGYSGAPNTNPLWGKPFCTTGGFGGNMLMQDPTVRHCGPYHPGGEITCPPDSIFVGSTGVSGTARYDAQDYFRDWVDAAALRVNCVVQAGEGCRSYSPALGGNGSADEYNLNERITASNLVIYSIGLGPGVGSGLPGDSNAGEAMLRYMAVVGDDGDRVTNPCAGVPPKSNCGNYYFAPTGAGLVQIFEDIAKRIFTRLTH
jgi:hypothetical protein